MANITWIASAHESYAKIIQQLDLEEALQLDDQLEDLLEQLQSFTKLCPESLKFPLFRKCIINKRFALIYSTDDKKIFIIAVVFNRSDLPF